MSEATTVESMRWNGAVGRPVTDAERHRITAEKVVAWVNANGGEARYEPESGSHTDMMLDPYHPARIAVRTRVGQAYCAPGQRVVMSEWWMHEIDAELDDGPGVREFIVTV